MFLVSSLLFVWFHAAEYGRLSWLLGARHVNIGLYCVVWYRIVKKEYDNAGLTGFSSSNSLLKASQFSPQTWSDPIPFSPFPFPPSLLPSVQVSLPCMLSQRDPGQSPGRQRMCLKLEKSMLATTIFRNVTVNVK